MADYFGHADEIKAQVRREVAVQVAAPQRPPTPAKAKRLALGILDGYVAQIPRGSPAEAKKLRAALAALRRDIQAYAAALAEQRAADDEEDDIIGILLN